MYRATYLIYAPQNSHSARFYLLLHVLVFIYHRTYYFRRYSIALVALMFSPGRMHLRTMPNVSSISDDSVPGPSKVIRFQPSAPPPFFDTLRRVRFQQIADRLLRLPKVRYQMTTPPRKHLPSMRRPGTSATLMPLSTSSNVRATRRLSQTIIC